MYQVQAAYADSLRQVLVATSDGVAQFRPAAAWRASTWRRSLARTAAAAARLLRRRRAGWGWSSSTKKTPEHFAREAARQAIVQLDAVEAPAGEMTVVLGPGWPGILLHEAVGHGLEADFNRKGVSAFSGRVGQQVASPLCTVVDDGTIRNRRGSLNVDDEGVAHQPQRAHRKRRAARLPAGPTFQPHAWARRPPATAAARATSTSPCRA